MVYMNRYSDLNINVLQCAVAQRHFLNIQTDLHVGYQARKDGHTMFFQYSTTKENYVCTKMALCFSLIAQY